MTAKKVSRTPKASGHQDCGLETREIAQVYRDIHLNRTQCRCLPWGCLSATSSNQRCGTGEAP